MTKKFEIGDKVIVTGVPWDNEKVKIGMKGVIKHIHPFGKPRIGVEFGGNVNGHNCNSHARNHYGWYMDEDEIELINSTSSDEITIYLKDTKTTVVLPDGTTGVANLMHGDTYSLEKGIEIAKAKALIVQKKKAFKSLLDEAKELERQQQECIDKLNALHKPLLELDTDITDLQEKVKVIGG